MTMTKELRSRYGEISQTRREGAEAALFAAIYVFGGSVPEDAPEVVAALKEAASRHRHVDLSDKEIEFAYAVLQQMTKDTRKSAESNFKLLFVVGIVVFAVVLLYVFFNICRTA